MAERLTHLCIPSELVDDKPRFGGVALQRTLPRPWFPSLVETAKINRVDPELYLKLAAPEGIGGCPIPLPHQLG